MQASSCYADKTKGTTVNGGVIFVIFLAVILVVIAGALAVLYKFNEQFRSAMRVCACVCCVAEASGNSSQQRLLRCAVETSARVVALIGPRSSDLVTRMNEERFASQNEKKQNPRKALRFFTVHLAQC